MRVDATASFGKISEKKCWRINKLLFWIVPNINRTEMHRKTTDVNNNSKNLFRTLFLALSLARSIYADDKPIHIFRS